ncbi:FAD dependent oxidoreductase [Rhodoferax ferrireducens T118]|uniref:FAD dependent oxidoreductase n=1 Tax=Albidiferax ferrireducens (strain ATCC BAA-621 / DSM 15236 / T118) TaxID=338969 RepID=Q21S83_ALBFT|nr:glycerol-3-phosphate dehydrogenase/oxidase [Rhodoferax ferrireducens]ABD71370.1 FAD dependent oxidoreductase [Rhodoferax ferrireducens T118]
MVTPTQPLFTQRAELISRLAAPRHYDIAIVGGGATGLGVALDAAARGFSVVLIESHDFAKGTSSRATKLVHGGVRYLAQGNIGLVREALRERTTLLHNAPYLAQPLAFVMPSYKWWEMPFYGIGLTLYDALAGKAGLGRTEFLSRAKTLALLPAAQPQGLKGGVKYWDGQFNDARLALALGRTAAARGALLVNYCRALDLFYQEGKVAGLVCEDTLTGQTYRIQSRCVVNAAGVWVDELRQKDGAANGADGRRPTEPMVAPSQGVHMVVDRDFLGGDTALMVPKTADGRVLFAVPWLGKVILGTTDTPRHDLAREPLAFKEEVDFILTESARYLRRAPKRADVKSIWVGLRPLVKPPDDEGDNTKGLSREHTVLVSRSGLVTVTGGKWTTYRAMAEDVLAQCAAKSLIDARAAGVTVDLKLVGADETPGQAHSISQPPGLHSYGNEQALVMSLPGAQSVLCDGLTEAMVRFAARYEYAITVEDVLARRSRLLFLDARLASSLAAQVGGILLQETGLDPQVDVFTELAQHYLCLPASCEQVDQPRSLSANATEAQVLADPRQTSQRA